ncbi:MAG: hypothetical protein K2M79_05925 [Muribaculaceae bacterium]|nr:hypothetical protein [Muribaculaceae bacterium]
MKLFKYFAFALAGVAFAACSDDTPSMNTADGVSVEFARASMAVPEGNSSLVNVPIKLNGEANGEVKVEVAFEGYGANPAVLNQDVFITSTSLIIPAGESTVNVEFYVTDNEIEESVERAFSLSIVDAQGAVIGTSSKCVVTLTDDDKPVDWVSLGMVKYTDPFLCDIFGFDRVTYDVEIQESGDTEGLYRLVAPYGAAFLAEMQKQDPTFVEEDVNMDGYLIIDATNPAAVRCPRQKLGVNWGHGDFEVMFMSTYYNEQGNDWDVIEQVKPESFGILSNGILTIAEKNAITVMDDGEYYGNSKGDTRMIVMPGTVLGDYSAQINYMGTYISADNNLSIVVSFDFGKDVKAAYAGATQHDVTGLISDLAQGNGVEVNMDSKTAVIPVEGPGDYVVAVVTYSTSAEENALLEITVTGGAAAEDTYEMIGYADYVDGFFIPGFGIDPYEWPWSVEVKRDTKDPVNYRLMDLYTSEDCPLAQEGLKPVNVDFQIYEAGSVVILPQYSGFEHQQLGVAYMCNPEGYYVVNDGIDPSTSSSYIKEEFRTVFADNIVTINLPMFASQQFTGGEFSNWKNVVAGEIILPEASADARVKAKAKRGMQLRSRLGAISQVNAKRKTARFTVNRKAALKK